MRIVLLCLMLWGSVLKGIAQRTTDKITVSGLVKKQVQIDKTTLMAAEERNAGSILITNEKGQPEFTMRNVKGVRVRELLSGLDFQAENPSKLNEFYLVFVGTDGRKAVFSWNELFNSVLGDEIYLITGRDNIALDGLKEKIALISALDETTGRRFVSNLEKIIVRRAE